MLAGFVAVSFSPNADAAPVPVVPVPGVILDPVWEPVPGRAVPGAAPGPVPGVVLGCPAGPVPGIAGVPGDGAPKALLPPGAVPAPDAEGVPKAELAPALGAAAPLPS